MAFGNSGILIIDRQITCQSPVLPVLLCIRNFSELDTLPLAVNVYFCGQNNRDGFYQMHVNTDTWPSFSRIQDLRPGSADYFKIAGGYTL